MSTTRKPFVFLSYSTIDREIVSKISKFLESHGVVVWFDSKVILPGQAIVDEIDRAIEKSDFMVSFFSSASIQSGWFRSEWQAKFYNAHSVGEQRIPIIPVLIDKCEIPPLVAQLSAIKLYEGMELALSKLLSALEFVEMEIRPRNTITEYTIDFLDDLKGEKLAFPVGDAIMIVDTLRRLPRSGKKVRLESFAEPRVQIRTIYDHILSVAHTADHLFDNIKHGIPSADASEIARWIAYHELSEVLLGDIPVYTNLSDRKRKVAQVHAELRLRSIPSSERQRISNEFLSMFLSPKQRESLRIVADLSADVESPLYKFARIIDKLDPIIAVWRYLHNYRGQLIGGPGAFLRLMRDFFENADVRSLAIKYESDTRIRELAATLQDRVLAESYYVDSSKCFSQAGLFGIEGAVVRDIIETHRTRYETTAYQRKKGSRR